MTLTSQIYASPSFASPLPPSMRRNFKYSKKKLYFKKVFRLIYCFLMAINNQSHKLNPCNFIAVKFKNLRFVLHCLNALVCK